MPAMIVRLPRTSGGRQLLSGALERNRRFGKPEHPDADEIFSTDWDQIDRETDELLVRLRGVGE